MKKYLVCAALVLSASTEVAPHARADDAKPKTMNAAPLQRAEESKKFVSFTLRNVTPSMVLWWIDPKRNPIPPQFKTSQSAAKHGFTTILELRDKLKRPVGIETLIANDETNTLLSIGTESGIGELKNLLAILDRPLRHVEIEARVVQLSAAAMKRFGLDFEKDRTKIPTVQNSDFSTVLASLEAQGDAKNLLAPSMSTTATDNVESSPSIEIITPVDLSASDDGWFGATKIPVSTRIGFHATPTIRDIDTISLALEPFFGRGVSGTKNNGFGKVGETTWTPFERPQPATFVTVKEGDTISVVAAPAREDGSIKATTKQAFAGGAVVFFFTARIIRGIEEPMPEI